jgi:hypothetical protein
METREMFEVLENAGRNHVVAEYTKGANALENLHKRKQALQGVSKSVDALEEAMTEILLLCDEIVSLSEETEGLRDQPSDIEGKTWGQVKEALFALIYDKLAKSSLAVKRAVCFPMLVRRFTPNDVNDEKRYSIVAMDWAIEKNFLTPNDDGRFLFRGRNFVISRNFGLTEKDKEKIEGLLAHLCRNASEAESLTREQPKPATPQKVQVQQITPGKAWLGTPGEFSLQLPVNGNGKTSVVTIVHDFGGVLVFKEGGNGFSDLCGTSIHFSNIKDDQGRLREKLALPETDKPDGRLRQRQERFGTILLQAFAPLVKVVEDIDPKEFLSNPNATGDTVLDFEKFDWHDSRHHEDDAFFELLSLRIARRLNGQMALTEILTEGAVPMFEDLLNQWHDPKDRFEGMPKKLGVFLRGAFGRYVRGKSFIS